ncbi:glycosyltransferase [Phenylobacterium sp.]|uniref:glycosyltransferase n=1 Tax=Phenylobacterium sp. TaxID=1871053 RepID=UPI002DE9EE8C|nr:glycosyltransferase [Phenylobacterium sp.]
MKLAYFVHDLTDPAVARRVRMLKAGGAEPVVLGFRREAAAPTTIEGVPAVDLGRTHDGRMLQRAAMTGLNALIAARLRRHLKDAPVIMARTLEALAVAEAARRMAGSEARLVYECLDIHRLMLGEGVKSRAMRAAERALMARADLLMVSSPAFLERYFEPRQGVGRDLGIPTYLIENKILELEPAGDNVTAGPPPGPPWRVGWMGAIRCRKSLAILTDLAARRPDLVDVRMHGRPAYSEFDDFDAEVAGLPNVSFGGSYSAADLPRLYGDVHFAWAIDFMEEGLNSSWLLPNRLYEASRHGAVPIALAGVQTGRYLADHGFGIRLESAADLESALEALAPARYRALRAEVAARPRQAFVAGVEDCRRLVAAVSSEEAPAAASCATFAQSRKPAAKGAFPSEHIPGEAV